MYARPILEFRREEKKEVQIEQKSGALFIEMSRAKSNSYYFRHPFLYPRDTKNPTDIEGFFEKMIGFFLVLSLSLSLSPAYVTHQLWIVWLSFLFLSLSLILSHSS